MDEAVTNVFYDAYNQHITIAVDSIEEAMMVEEDDGSILFSFEQVKDIEFYWPPDEQMWRAV